tara:strand:- start:1719 stop:2054 length:336 start_codon:yes stop_codon:yes gene_type:complete
MIGGEILVRSMGGADILTLAKAYSGNNTIEYKEIGLKPGEKYYEDLITEAELERTYIMGDYYVIVPEIYEFFKDEIKEKLKKYWKLPKMNEDVRSDTGTLTVEELRKMIFE